MKIGVEKIYLRLADEIHRIRRNKDVSQLELAALTGVSRPMIAAIENGNTRIMLHHLIKICQVLKVDYRDLLEDCDR